jgi:hypothetical protein
MAMNETVLRKTAMQVLIDRFGVVETERFISSLSREPFDYTVWQRDLWGDKTVDEIFALAQKRESLREQVDA